jgi:capsular polysaccharide biosynthesis protein
MNQNNTQPSIYNEEIIDLRELKESRTLIFSSILFFATLAAIYSFFILGPKYNSSTLIEIGHSDINGEKVLIESPEVFRDDLKVNFLYKNLNKALVRKNIKFTIMDNKIISVDLTSSSAEINEEFLSKLISYSINSHNKKAYSNLNQLINNTSLEVESIDLELNLIDDEVKQLEGLFDEVIQLEVEGLFNAKTAAIEKASKINQLLKDKSQISQRKKVLERQLEQLKTQKIFNTQAINDILTIEVSPKRILIIALGMVFGLFISFVVIFFRNLIRAIK